MNYFINVFTNGKLTMSSEAADDTATMTLTVRGGSNEQIVTMLDSIRDYVKNHDTRRNMVVGGINGVLKKAGYAVISPDQIAAFLKNETNRDGAVRG